ncbi:MAG TPA: META domain-containing protein [Gemmatimonadaceae bacterium]|nr:META domain-containing protein [Gemmatimonadaceae bacterium]
MRNGTAALVVVLSVACASLGRSSTSALVDREWRLVSLHGQPAVPSTGMRAAGLRMSGDSLRMSGSGGCNRIGATYTLDGDRLSFGPILATRMACADALLNRQETDFLAALQATTRYRIAGDTLILAGAGDDLARLLRAAR